MVRFLGHRLQIPKAVIVEACVEQDSKAVLRLICSPVFRPNSRWIATRTGIPLDGVNTALHWLLYKGEITMTSPEQWEPNHKSKLVASGDFKRSERTPSFTAPSTAGEARQRRAHSASKT
jgi:hypothetical protein